MGTVERRSRRWFLPLLDNLTAALKGFLSYSKSKNLSSDILICYKPDLEFLGTLLEAIQMP